MNRLHYGWVMVILAVFTLTIYAFTLYTFGVFLRPLTLEFGWERGALSGAYSMYALLSGVLGIPVGRLSDKYGPRILVTIGGLLIGAGFLMMSLVNSLWQTYLIWGIFMGMGSTCCYIPVMSTIPQWFTRRRGIAMGLTVTGTGLGGVISAPLAQWFISSYGWQQANINLGIISLIVVIPLAQFLKHNPMKAGLKPYGEDMTIENIQPLDSPAKELSLNQIIKNGRFWLIGSTVFCFLFIVQAILAHIVPHAIDVGIPAMVAASIISIISATSLIGRNFVGFICDRIGARPTLTALLSTVTLSLVWLLFAKETWMFYIFAVIFGYPGGIFSIATLILAEIFGLSSLGIILGSILLIGTIGAAIGAPLVGSIFDITGSYSIGFVICIITGALAIGISLILLRLKGNVMAANQNTPL